MAYITESDLENFILQDIDSSYSTWIATVIGYVEEYIDQYLGTSFAGSSAGVIRYFDGSGQNELFVGDFTALTEVKILDTDGNDLFTLVQDEDYYLYPLNSTVKNSIRLVRSGRAGGIFPGYNRAVKITGTYGYGSANIPAPIKLVAIKLASKIINEGLRGGQVSSETLGSYSIDYKEIDETTEAMGIKDILNKYRPILLE